MTRPQDSPAEPFAADELERLLTRAEQDPEASAELDFLADLVAAADIERLRLDALPAARRSRGLLERQWLVPVAASLLFLGALAAWFLWGRTEPVSALAQHGAPRYVALELRDAAGVDDGFARAMEPYASGDHVAAAAALQTWLEAHPGHGPARFYLAACREQLGALDQAAADYREVADREPGFLGQHARWRLANLALAREDAEGARAELRRLLESPGDFGNAATELLHRLDAEGL